MPIYSCPKCGERSIMWDSRSGVFLCHNPACAISVYPPQEKKMTEKEVAQSISLNRLNVTQEWLNGTMRSQHARCQC